MTGPSLQEMNWLEALSEFKLDFDVETVPAGIVGDDGNFENVDDLYAMRRTDTRELLRGVGVGKRYNVIQTSSYADIGDRITGQMDAKFVRGGTLKEGRLAFLQAKLPECIRVKGTNDIIEEEITFINSFDGSTPFMILPLGFRIFCENQMAAINRAMRKSGGLKIRHTRSADERLKQADQAVLEALNAFRAFEVKVNWLADQKFTDAQMELATRRLLKVAEDLPEEDIATRTMNNMNQIRELFENGRGVAQWRGTAWAAYNAITEYADHHRSIRKNTDPFEAKLLGSGATMKDNGLLIVNKLIEEAA